MIPQCYNVFMCTFFTNFVSACSITKRRIYYVKKLFVFAQIPPLPQLKVSLVEAPGIVQIEQAFKVTCLVTNTRQVTFGQVHPGRRGLGYSVISFYF